ncbi:MAG TPA: molybdenum cofactor biosynthesis protein MoaE [Thermoanaerobaculia bacterium]|nr:molybdenum cofactor biosynthesis protein MoaE [Thermoanaerobaculia bacterium]
MSFLTDIAIDAEALSAEVCRDSDGAVVTFSGFVRDHHEGRQVESIFYEAYRPMAENEIRRVVESVAQRLPEVRMAVQHRLGLVRVGEASIVIACASPHRAEAFDACRALIDGIKEMAPIWKKERSPDGEEWVGWQGGGRNEE